MKNTSLIISILALAGVLIFGGLSLSNRNSKPGDSSNTASADPIKSFQIAYINIDSFEAHYDYLKKKKDEFSNRQDELQRELERSLQQYQSKVEDFQRKLESGQMSQSEGESAQKQLLQMQQTLRLKEQALTEKLLKEQDEFNKQLHDRLYQFLEEYNHDRRYDYILSYSELGSQVLWVDKKYDITADVIKGMNERAEKETPTDGQNKK